MKSIKLNTGAEMPIFGLGTFLSSPGEVYQAVRWAIKLGYKHIDCAAAYGNQSEVGQALHDAFAEGDIKREEIFITSKLWNDSHAVSDVIPACEKTLQELGLEYLDLYLMHWPVAQRKGSGMPKNDEDWIPLTEIPLWETWSEMEKLYNAGKVRAIGVSNFNEANISNLISKTQVVPAVNQVECHPFLNQNRLIEFCRKDNIAVTAYSPLGAQRSDGSVLDNEVVKDIAARNNATPAQILLAWQMQRGIIVIPKSVHEARIKENAGSQSISLDAADMQKLEGLNKNLRFFDGSAFENPAKGYNKIF